METIYLTGYHGTGKSLIGKLIASRKDLKFIDVDSLVEDKEKKSKREVLNTKGIDYCNNIEKYILKNNVQQGMIVSLPAEGPRDEESIRIIKTSGRVIYLRSKADTILERIKNDSSKSSNMDSNTSIFTIEKGIEEMKPYYEELANYIIDVDNKNLNSVFMEALAIYNYANKVKCHIFIK